MLNIIPLNIPTISQLVVELTDGNSPAASKVAIVVYITSTNDNTPAISNLNSVTLAENTAVGTQVSTCTITDADYTGSADATITTSITGRPNAL